MGEFCLLVSPGYEQFLIVLEETLASQDNDQHGVMKTTCPMPLEGSSCGS